MNNFKKRLLREESDFEDEEYDSEKDSENEDYGETYSRRQINSVSDSDGNNSDSDNDYRREKNELEVLREKNIKERDAFLAMLMSDPEYADVVSSENELKRSNIQKIIRPKKDPSFRYSGQCSIPVEIRRSSRLQNIPPVFFKEDLIDEIEINRKRKRSQEYDYYDLETVIYQPRKSKTSHNTIRAQIIPIEDITENMIDNIARKGTIKIYSESGTSCHQCRQKTKDQKTYCRSSSCMGVRGQFCGVCLENRYGEDVAKALKDPIWKCPVCRGICNCSFCRAKAGKRPTGILAPLAQQSGHKSVKDFLESLKGEGDYAHQDFMWEKMNDPKYLLGYSKDLKFAHMGGGVTHEINYFLTWKTLKDLIWQRENELESLIDLHIEPRCLLGFFQGTDKALLNDGSHCFMGPAYLKYDQLIQQVQAELDIVEEEYSNMISDVSTRKHLSKQGGVTELEKNYSECLKGIIKKEENELIRTHLVQDMKDGVNINNKLNVDKIMEVIKEVNLDHSNKNENNSDENLDKPMKYVQQAAQELQIGYSQDKPKNLLGFLKDTNNALVDDGTWHYLGPVNLKNNSAITEIYKELDKIE